MFREARRLGVGVALALLAWFAIGATAGQAQNRPAPPLGPASVYFLSVGIEEYSVASKAADLTGAENSARIVADALIDAGATYGILLTSKLSTEGPGHTVTRADVYSAFTELKRQMRKDAPVAPRIVVYIMGHGAGDAVSGWNFMLPGDLPVPFDQLRQSKVQKALPYQSIWNVDILTAAFSFRSHPSMDHMDDFYFSQTFPPGGNPFGLTPQQRQRKHELNDEIRRRQRAGVFPPEGNPPVPYVVLLDTCSGEVEQDLGFIVPKPMERYLRRQFKKAFNEGLALYASPPGKNARSITVPSFIDATGVMGPLGARLVDVLQTAQPGDTLAGMLSRLKSGRPVTAKGNWQPYVQSGTIEQDTAITRFLPDSLGRVGRYDTLYGTGGS